MRIYVLWLGFVFLLLVNSSIAFSMIDSEGKESKWIELGHVGIYGGMNEMMFFDLHGQIGKCFVIGGIYFRDKNVLNQDILGNFGFEVGPRFYSDELVGQFYCFGGINAGFSNISSGAGALMGPTKVETNGFYAPNFGLIKRIGNYYIAGIAELFIYNKQTFLVGRFGIGK